MTSSKHKLWIALAILAQGLILVGMLLKAQMPLWTGTEVRVKTVPVDPRSLFRGNYAELAYDFNRLSPSRLHSSLSPRLGEVVYVSLQMGEDGLYHATQAALEPPDEGIFLRGRITDNYGHYRVKYGIEAFFAPKEKALKLERELRDSAVAVLMVSDTGRAALREVIPSSDGP